MLGSSNPDANLTLCCRHVRTLVLDLDDLLVHSDWTRGRGWRTFKRPGAEDFLKQMAQLYEIVIYTHALPTYADPILDRLDPSRYIVYRLYRDSTLYQHGHHVRDLSKLNRDMEKVLFVTSDPEACKLHPNNAVLVSLHTALSSSHCCSLLICFLKHCCVSSLCSGRPTSYTCILHCTQLPLCLPLHIAVLCLQECMHNSGACGWLFCMCAYSLRQCKLSLVRWRCACNAAQALEEGRWGPHPARPDAIPGSYL